MTNSLDPSEVRTGQLVDGESGTPYQSCTLTYELGQGALLSIPYVSGEPQFAATEQWFRKQEPPRSLIFCDNKGQVTLTGIRWRGYTGGTLALGRLGADIVIFQQPRRLKPEYSFNKLMSRIDGLQSFTRFQSIDQENSFEEDGIHKVIVTVKAAEKVTWRHGGFTYSIRAQAPWESTLGMKFSASSETILETSRYRGATADNHISAQWPIRALLILAHGTELYWREHMILDNQFPIWMMSGRAEKPMYVPIQHRRTIRDVEQPENTAHVNSFPAFQLEDLGSRGLRKWFQLYDDPIMRRAIEPVVEVINGASRFLEPQVLMTVLGLEAMGHFRDSDRKRNVRLFEQIERCITATKVEWGRIGPEIGIAKAIANVNNDLKHPDRPNRPGGLELSLVSRLSRVIMRMQLFDLLELPESLRERFAKSMEMHYVFEEFKLNGMKIDSDGKFIDVKY